MRRLLVALVSALTLGGVSANAADMPVKAPVKVAPIPMYNWTGLYIGVNGGGGWGHTDWSYVVSGNTADHDTSGGVIGGTIGYNYQYRNWVFGIEGDVDWANINGSTACPNPAYSCESKIKSIGTIRGRVGPVLGATGNVLLYATGGWAWDRITIQTVHPTVGTNGSTDTSNGWVLGAGVEYAFAPSWSAKLEYLYARFSTDQFTVDSNLAVDAQEHVNLVRVGLNYKFWSF